MGDLKYDVVREFTGESGAAQKIVMAQRQRQNDKNVSPDSCHKVLVSRLAKKRNVALGYYSLKKYVIERLFPQRNSKKKLLQ